MKCLNCDAELDQVNLDNGKVVCGCGIKYDPGILEKAKPEMWEKVRESKRFMRSGSSIHLFNATEMFE